MALLTGLLTLLLGMYVAVEALRVPVLSDASWLRDVPAVLAGLGAFGLLALDVALPVPSSVVMIANGALFGLPIGAMLSLAGASAASVIAFALGRRAAPLMQRLVPLDDRRRADRLLARWGATAVVITRPVPILAEAVAFMAGASPLAWQPFTIAAVAGCFPGAVVYAAAGAAASGADPLLVLVLVIVLATPFWLVARRLGRPPAPSAPLR